MSRAMVHKYHNENYDDLLKTGVYTITSISTGRVYVGSATSILCGYDYGRGFYRRWNRHLYELRGNKHNNIFLQRHVNKYGLDDLKFEILDFYDPEYYEGAEMYWINLLDSKINGFNMTLNYKGSCGKSHPMYKYVDEKSIIKEYLTTKESIKKIANKYNISDKKLISVLKKNNIKLYNKNFYNYENNFNEVKKIHNYYLNHTNDETSAKYNIDSCTFSKYFKIHKLPMKNDLLFMENIKICKEFNEGKTRRELQKKYNRSIYSIGNAIRLYSKYI